MNLHLETHQCSDMLQGSQDHTINIVDNNIYIAGGFCTGINGVQTPLELRDKINKRTNHNRGFIKELFKYSILENKWEMIKKLPPQLFQYGESIVIGKYIYIWGGFSYTPLSDRQLISYKKQNIALPSKSNIYTYADGFYIDTSNNTIHKTSSLPFPMAAFKIINDKKNRKLYFLNGFYYDRKSFNTFKKNGNTKIGSSFFTMLYDESDNIIPNSVSYINNFPGTPRASANTHLINNTIYVIGGCTTTNITNNSKGYSEYTYNNVIDNWKYDISNNTWTQIQDSIPICNQGSVVYKNRYVIQMGGLQYNTTYLLNGKIVNSNSLPHIKKFPFNNISTIKNNYHTNESGANQFNLQFSNLIIIYDTITNNYIISDSVLPININAPRIVIKNDWIYIFGGEGSPQLLQSTYYGNCLSLGLKIDIYGKSKIMNFSENDANNYFLRNKESHHKEILLDKIILRYIQNYMKLNKHSTIIEIGCCCGYRLNQLSKKINCNLYGLDLSLMAINYGKKLYPNINFKQGNILTTTYKKKFDVVICGFFLYYISSINLKKIVSKIKELLKPQSYLLIYDFYEKDFTEKQCNHRTNLMMHKMDHSKLFLDFPEFHLISRNILTDNLSSYCNNLVGAVVVDLLYKDK